VSWGQDRRRWASGAAVAGVAAGAGLSTHQALRADSTGAPGLPVLLLGGVLLALALWPLVARATSVLTLTAVLAVAQFGSHALAVAATGHAADPRALVCCPSSAQVRPGLLGTLTAQAGWDLVAVQVLACLLLAVAVRGGQAAADLTAAAADLVRAIVSTAVSGLVALAWLLRQVLPTVPSGPACPSRPTPARVLDAGRVLARRTRRRGPPRPVYVSPVLSRAAVAPRSLLPAAG
jgi:hypothetical protein